jgi:TonB family protein
MVKKLLFLIVALLLLVPAKSFSQRVKKVKPPKDPEWVLMVTPEGKLQRAPTFKLQNPKESFMRWLGDNLKVPRGVQGPFYGTSVVQFYIEPDGEIVQVDILKSCGNFYLDKAAVDVISSSPTWEPATFDGEPTVLKYTMPVTFKIPGANSASKKSGSRF